ncbi:MAG: hypothetical protein ABUK01_04260 [Leptospirales bacterium]
MGISNYRKSTGVDSYLKQKNLAQDAKIEGVVILFDIVNSSGLKECKQFPNWIEDYTRFIDLITKPFADLGIVWHKFLGDAFMFFIPTRPDKKIHKDLKHMSFIETYNLCKLVLTNYWSEYKTYSEIAGRGHCKHDNFREITCAIDYGKDIFNWYQLLDDQSEDFDPIGKTVDRCFRYSSIAGASQLLVSEYFYEELKKENKSSSIDESFIKVSLKNGTLKGFDNVHKVYYSVPDQDIIDYYTNDDNVKLIEHSKAMDVKVKLKLLRLKNQKNSSNTMYEDTKND